jgi:Tfp pilus assembly protein PilN
VRAVNLIPSDARRASVGSVPQFGPSYIVLALLTAAVALVTVYVLTSNTISSRKAQVASLNAQAAQEKTRVAGLADYQKFAKLAEARAETVREIAGTRFDWYGALSDLSKVVPANTALQTLFASVAPDASTGGSAGGGSGSALRGDISAPALELTGCTKSQDDVARLMSRLRLINGVTRVTLGNSVKQSSSQSGTTVGTGGSSSTGCGANGPNFDLVVFFKPLPGATATGAGPTSTPAGGVATPAQAASTAHSASSSSTTTTSTTSPSPSSGGSK